MVTSFCPPKKIMTPIIAVVFSQLSKNKGSTENHFQPQERKTNQMACCFQNKLLESSRERFIKSHGFSKIFLGF